MLERTDEQIKIFSPNQAGQATVQRKGAAGQGSSWKYLSSDIEYSDLVSVLGKPTFTRNEAISQLPVIQWVGTIGGEPFVINDGQKNLLIALLHRGQKGFEKGEEWKEGSEFEESGKYNWNVGAATEDTIDRFIEYLDLELRFDV